MTTPLIAHVAAILGCAVVVGAGGCGKSGSVVGGACADGYAQCGQSCVDLLTDPRNCGACGHGCAAGVACVGGVCGDSAFTGGGDASVDGRADAGGDAAADSTVDALADVSSTGDAPATDAPLADAPLADAPLADAPGAEAQGDALAADAPTADAIGADGGPGDGSADDAYTNPCVPPFNTPTHCGDCFTSCTAGTPICSPTEAGPNECAAQCNSPYVACGILCIDMTRDPQNCGSCGAVCASNLCADSVCAGSTPGEDIVIGHDYYGVLPGTAEAQVLANAVLLPVNNPLRILSFEEYANPTSVARVKAIIAAAASAQARTVSITVTNNDADIPGTLSVNAFDLLLVYDQGAANAQTLSTLGAGWSSTLGTFLSVGGAVVTLDGASGQGQMPVFLSQSMLLNVASHTPVAFHTPLNVAAPGDSVATGVVNPYGALSDTVSFTADPESASIVYVVVNPTGGSPVVVHRTIR